jgi:nicotinate-nucleotide adenylyltransferase
MVHIALFGTSADPPTVGHQAILEWLAVQFDWVAVWAVDNPFKTQQTPLMHRQAMLLLLVTELSQRWPHVLLCDHLSDARTLHSVYKAQLEWPQGQLTVVVGSDVLRSLPNWYKVSELLSTIELLIIPRPGVPISPTDLQTLEQLGGRFAIAPFTGPDVSSTDYRQMGIKQSMIPAIADYIHQNRLYTR